MPRVSALFLVVALGSVLWAQQDEAKGKDPPSEAHSAKEEAEARIKELNARVERLYDQGKYADAALRARLGSALSAAIVGTKTLYLSPDGTLATIPWGLLPSSAEATEGGPDGDRFRPSAWGAWVLIR